MTLQELYAAIGGNYEHALQIMRLDKMIDKYLRKFAAGALDADLRAAAESGEPGRIFDAAHALKGVTANLGLDDLAAAVGAVTEEYRPGAARKLSDAEVQALLAQVRDLCQRAAEGIARYAAGE